MTIYGTPGGTPLNTSPFQGTAPGIPGQPVLQPTNPGVGLFPPNSNNASGDTVMAAASRGAVPANVQVSGVGLTSAQGTGVGAGGRVLLESLSKGGENGTNAQNGMDTMNSDLNGGNSFGAGGANQTEAPSSGQSSQLSTPNPSNTLTLQASPTVIYGG